MVGRHSVEPTFERSEANVVSILPLQQHQDARCARTAFGGRIGSTECRPTTVHSQNQKALSHLQEEGFEFFSVLKKRAADQM